MRAKRPGVDGQCPATGASTATRPATPDPGRPRSATRCLLPGIWCANKGRKEKIKKTQTSSDLRQRSPFPRSSNDRLRLLAESKNVSVTTRSERPKKKQSKPNSPCFDPQVTDDSSTFGKPEVNLWQALVNRNKSQVCANFFSFVGN